MSRQVVDQIALEVHPAVVALTLAADEDIEIALHHLDQQNYGLARDWLRQAQLKLPKDSGEGGITRWPQPCNFEADIKFRWRPEYVELHLEPQP